MGPDLAPTPIPESRPDGARAAVGTAAAHDPATAARWPPSTPPPETTGWAPRALFAADRRDPEAVADSAAAQGSRRRARLASASVWLVPRAVQVVPGDTFRVLLMADAQRPLSHLPVSLDFDPDVLAVEAVETGSFLGSADEVQMLADSTTPGRLVIGASRLGDVPGVTGRGVLAEITLRAIAAGDTTLSFSDTRALDTLLRPLSPFRATGGRVSVAPGGGDVPQVPHRPRPQTPRTDDGEGRSPRS